MNDVRRRYSTLYQDVVVSCQFFVLMLSYFTSGQFGLVQVISVRNNRIWSAINVDSERVKTQTTS